MPNPDTPADPRPAAPEARGPDAPSGPALTFASMTLEIVAGVQEEFHGGEGSADLRRVAQWLAALRAHPVGEHRIIPSPEGVHAALAVWYQTPHPTMGHGAMRRALCAFLVVDLPEHEPDPGEDVGDAEGWDKQDAAESSGAAPGEAAEGGTDGE